MKTISKVHKIVSSETTCRAMRHRYFIDLLPPSPADPKAMLRVSVNDIPGAYDTEVVRFEIGQDCRLPARATSSNQQRGHCLLQPSSAFSRPPVVTSGLLRE